MKAFVPLSMATTALAASRTSAPSGCLTVSAGGGGDYSTIQEAVDSLSTTSGEAQCIFLEAGTYAEQVVVEDRAAQLSIYGHTSDTSGWEGNGATITASASQDDGLSNDETATLRVRSPGFRLYNVNVDNGRGEGSQAVALSAYADSAYYGCALTGFQDTLLSNRGYQLYAASMIQGATDFVFGQEAASWFERVDLRVLARSKGYITANGRESSSGSSYYVFNNCDVAAASGESVSAGAYYLGRPWREYARVVFQQTSMSAVVNAAGWSVWNSGDERTGGVLFGEYGNTGEGAASAASRADFATALDAPIDIAEVLGSGYASAAYYDAEYM